MENVTNLKRLSGIGLMAAALMAAASGTATAGPSDQCDIYQRHVVRVAMSIAIGPTALDQSVIMRGAEQLWAFEGLDIDWIDESHAADDDRLDAWVVIDRKSNESSSVPARADGVTRRVVRISIDDVVGHLEQKLSIQMQLTPDAARHLMFGKGHMIERSLGCAIAHKLGHSVMGLPHASAGLMSAHYATAGSTTQLAAESRKLLQRRFSVGCAAQ